ncbi:hypothetical protein GCM10020358_61130 [Amorphoplanes nipponensis]
MPVGQDHHPGGPARDDLGDHVGAAGREVRHDHVGAEPGGGGEHVTGRGLAGHAEVRRGVQHGRYTGADQRYLVGDQHPDGRHAVAPGGQRAHG